ncbi:protease SohB, partial [Halomonas sp. BBD48]|nr:protease SohB [Halomonas sp. BBD48]
MIDWIADYGMFLAQVATFAIIGLLFIAVIARTKGNVERSKLRVEELNGRYRSRQRRLRLTRMGKKQRKAALKVFKKEDKQAAQAKDAEDKGSTTVWVIDFHGDIKASATSRLSQEVSALLGVVEQGDEVVIRLESPGGLVHAYGLAAAELDRLREAGVTTT